MNTSFKRTLGRACVYVLALSASIDATHNTSRYLFLLEHPQEYIIKKRSHIIPEIFYISASTAHRQNRGSGGIPIIWGEYNLKNVISSVQIVSGNTDPIFALINTLGYNNKDIVFRVDSKIRGIGLYLNWEQELHLGGLQVGATLPVMSMSTNLNYAFDRYHGSDQALFQSSALTPQQKYIQDLNIDIIRRRISQLSGVAGNVWSKGGFGDLDLHVRWNHIFDHVVLTKSIDINFQLGTTVPTGLQTDINYPSSIPFGNNGFWTLYGDFVTEIELKQDYTFGFMLGFVGMFSDQRTLRVSVADEPTIFSALTIPVRISPGFSFKASPYFTLGNLSDGLDFQLRYTYLHHNKDRWTDLRSNQVPASYLATPSLVGQKENLSEWQASYITFNLSYDIKEAMNRHFTFDPKIFAMYDMPIGGRGFVKTYQFTVGAELHF